MNNYHYLFKFIIVGESSSLFYQIRCWEKLFITLIYRRQILGWIWCNYWCRIWIQRNYSWIKVDKIATLGYSIDLLIFRRVKNLFVQLQELTIEGNKKIDLHRSIGCILVYDITRRITFDRIIAWVKDVK